ncbi:MAG TPA: hypothetical protein VJH23_00780 [archaeon]|nr:hypothetical protein [archaeon]
MHKKTPLNTGPEGGNESGSRFKMVKKRHRKTYETALSQGKVDEQMKELCSFVTGTENYFTSSCCSGRIMLLEKRGDKKTENFFHRKWHRNVTKKELLEGFLENVSGEMWFKLDPFILHIGCEDIEHANEILFAMKKSGVKRGGIMVAEEGKVLIELQGTEQMSFPLKLGKKMLVSEGYLSAVLPKANKMLSKNYKRLSTLCAEFQKQLR